MAQEMICRHCGAAIVRGFAGTFLDKATGGADCPDDPQRVVKQGKVVQEGDHRA